MKKELHQLMYVMAGTLKILFLQIFFTTTMVASDLSAQVKSIKEVYVKIDFQDHTLIECLNAIEKVTDYSFSYDKNLIKRKPSKINYFANNKSVESLLLHISETYNIKFKQINNVINVLEIGAHEKPVEIVSIVEQITVSGTVTDENGESLPGATVQEMGTTNGTITDIEGSFSLKLPEDAIVMVSFVGYETQEISVNNRSIIDVQLMVDSEQLDEVVVIGYGEVKKSDLTGSVARIDDESFKMLPITQISEMLIGNVAGLNSVQGTSASGGSNLEIRGPNSLSAGSDPLIVLDGAIYYGSVSDINPMDIKSIDILKDASSAAIFGAKSASGVLLITTIKGEEGKPQIKFSSKVGVADVTNKKIRPFDENEFFEFRRDFLRHQNVNQPDYYYFNPNELPSSVSVNDWLNYSNNPSSDEQVEWLSRLQLSSEEIDNYMAGNYVDWYDRVMQKGLRQSYDISISGGTKRTSYYWSMGYTHNEGIIYGDQFGAIRSRINLSTKIADFLTVGTNTQLSYRDNSSIPANLNQMFVSSPWGTDVNEDGTLRIFTNASATPNPMLNPTYQKALNDSYGLFSSVFASVELPFGFTYKLTYQPRLEFINDYNFWPSSTMEGSITHSGGYGTRDDIRRFGWQLDNLIKWNKEIGVHRLDFTFLYNAEKNQSWRSFQSGENFSPNENLSFHALEFGSKVTVENTDTYSTGDALMGRVNYTLLDKYLITGSIRRDGYSAFGIANKRAAFPAAAFAWQTSREGFWNDNWLVNRLKFRVSWGINGNRDIGEYASLARLSQNLYYNGSQVEIGVYNSSLSNNFLAWEKTESFNIGFDMGMFENRVDVSFNIYSATTSDLLMLRNLPQITGFKDVYANLGELSNKGIELTLNSVNVDNQNFRWESNFVFSLNRNKINKLFGDVGEYTLENEEHYGELPDFTNEWFPGQPVDRVWDYNILGVWQLNEVEEAGKYNQEPGDYKVLDVNGDSIYRQQDDKQFIGWRQPRFRLGLKNDFRFYNRFTASVFLRADVGHVESIPIFEGKGDAYERKNIRNRPYWSPENPTNEFGALKTNSGGFSGGLNVYFPRTFLRVQNVLLSYSVPIKDDSKLSQLKLYGSIQNFLTFDQWQDWDPESINSPMPRIFTVGVDVMF